MEFLRLLAEIRNPALDRIMLAISYLGTPYVMLGIFILFYLIIDKEEAYGIGFSFCFSCLFCQAAKVVARVPRPWNLDTSFEPVPEAVPSATGYSFPSVHTQSAASILGSVFYYNKKRVVRIVTAVLIALIGFSRMYLGCHTPVDVLAGLLAGILISAISWYFWNKVRKERRPPDMLAFFLLAFGILLIFLASALLFNATIDYANAADSFKMAGVSIGLAVAMFVEPRALRFSVEGTILKKILRFAIGLGGLLLVSAAIKAIPTSTSIPLLVIRYALMLLYITLCTPWICLKTGLMETKQAALRTPKI